MAERVCEQRRHPRCSRHNCFVCFAVWNQSWAFGTRAAWSKQSDWDGILCPCSLWLLCAFVGLGLWDHLTVEAAEWQDFRLSSPSLSRSLSMSLTHTHTHKPNMALMGHRAGTCWQTEGCSWHCGLRNKPQWVPVFAGWHCKSALPLW